MNRRLLSNVSTVATLAARALSGPLAAEASTSSSSASTPAKASSHCEAMAASMGTLAWRVSRNLLHTRKEGGRGQGGCIQPWSTRSGSGRLVRAPDLSHRDAAHGCRGAVLRGVHAKQQRCLRLLGVLGEPNDDPRPHLLDFIHDDATLALQLQALHFLKSCLALARL